jgi:hypothetical protein
MVELRFILQITGPKIAPYRPGANDSATFKTLYANPAEEQGAMWIVVPSAGTMSLWTRWGSGDPRHKAHLHSPPG